MLKIVFFCGLLQAANAAQSMEQVRSGLATVQAEVDKMPSSARQVAISALLKSVADQPATTMSDEALQTLQDVIDFLTNIIPVIQEDKNWDQRRMQQLEMDVRTCNTNFLNWDSERMDNATGARQAHVLCRQDEDPLAVTETEKCDELSDLMDEISNPSNDKCTKPDTPSPWTDSNMQEWIDFINAGDSHFTTVDADWATKKSDCQSAQTARAAQKAICDPLQETFERKHCYWWNWRQSNCPTTVQDWMTEYDLMRCYADASSAHALEKENVEERSASRSALVLTILRVRCLIGKIINGEAIVDGECVQDLDDVHNINGTILNLTVNYPDLPARSICSTQVGSAVNPYPGAANWETSANSGYTQFDVAHNTVLTCAQIPPQGTR